MGPVTDTHKLTYQRNVVLATQQRGMRLAPAFQMKPDWKGKETMVTELVGPSNAVINQGRKADTPDIDQDHEPIWVRPTQITWGKIVEDEDAIKALTDFQSEYTQSGASAVARARDAILAGSVFGPRLIGGEVPVSTAYDSTGRLVPVDLDEAGTPHGLTVSKLTRAKKLLQKQNVEIEHEELFYFGSADEIEDLYSDIEYIGKDFREKSVLDASRKWVLEVAGVTILHTESMPFVAGDATIRRGSLVCKSTLAYGDFYPLKTFAERNPAKSYRIHPFMENWLGATRIEDSKVIEVRNKVPA